jgi:hypothetical protein
MSRDYIFIDDPIVTLKKPRHWWQFRLKKADKRREQLIIDWYHANNIAAKTVRVYRELLLYGEAQIPVSGISGEPPE